MRLISISGNNGSGKDTAALALYEIGFEKISFSHKVKDVVAALFSWDRTVIEGTTPEHRAKREELDDWWSEQLDMEISMRTAMEEIATRLMRDNFHKDIWALALMARLRKDLASENPADPLKYVCTDSRFLNELNMMKQLGATMVGVHRNLPKWLDEFYSYCDTLIRHETGLGLMELDYNESWHREFAVDVGRQFFNIHPDSKYSAYRHESHWQHWLYNDYDHIVNNNSSIAALLKKIRNLV